jgi:squalene cyclase
VTAAVAGIVGLPDRERTLNYLRRHQRRDGSWPSYWWAHDAVATTLAVEALASTGRADDRDRVRRAVTWAASAVRADGSVTEPTSSHGSPFLTALVLSTIARSDDPSARAAATSARAWLFSAQSTDGSWAPSACLRVPPPDLVDPEERSSWGVGGEGENSIGNVVRDRGVHTTSTVVRALALG